MRTRRASGLAGRFSIVTSSSTIEAEARLVTRTDATSFFGFAASLICWAITLFSTRAKFVLAAASRLRAAACLPGVAAIFLSAAAKTFSAAAEIFGDRLRIAGSGPARIPPENILTKFVPDAPVPAPSSGTPVEPVSPPGVVPTTVSL